MATKKPTVAKPTLRQQAEAFAALPKKERKAVWPTLPKEVKLLGRELVTSRNRGFRHVNGRIEFSKKRLAEEIARLKEKRDAYASRGKIISSKIAEYEAEYAERFGGGENE